MLRHVVSASLAFGIVLLSVTFAQAGGNPDNGPGCGLGKLAWLDYGDRSKSPRRS